MSKRKHTASTATASPTLKQCMSCGSRDFDTTATTSGTEEYCTNCGTITDDPHFEPTHPLGTTYIPHPAILSRDRLPRLHNRWSREHMWKAKEQTAALCLALGQLGLAERAERIYTEAVCAAMAEKEGEREGGGWVFGERMAKWVAGCVYLAGIEARCGLGMADVSAKAGVSLYEVGAAAKRVAGLAAVGMERPAADVCIERLVDRILGCALRCAANNHGEAQGEGERPWILECISGPRRKKLRRARNPAGQCAEGDLAGDLLRFLGGASGRAARSRMVEMATGLAALGHSTGRTTGLGMGTVSGLAVSLALEHVCGWPLRHSQRLVLVRLVSLHAHVSAAHLMTRVEGTLRSLAADALRWVPWLREGEVDKDSVPAYFGDIVGCFGHSLISGGADSESQLVADAPASVVVGGPPAFERARRLEACRRELLDGAGAGAGEELRRARDAGVDLPSVMSLPMHTLDEMKKSRERAAKRTEWERRRLDDEEVGPEDMSDDEASAYLI